LPMRRWILSLKIKKIWSSATIRIFNNKINK
jgi:hypothetical protein